MDLSAFDPEHDNDGKRLRSLSLYGFPGAVRAADRFAADLDRVVGLAAHFLPGAGAVFALVGDTGPFVLAAAGTALPDGVSPARVWPRLADGPAATVIVSDAGGTGPVTVVAAPVTGLERVPIGLLAVWRPGTEPVPSESRWLVDQLARAAVATLDERRRLLGRRGVPPARPLRLAGGPDRRRDQRR